VHLGRSWHVLACVLPRFSEIYHACHVSWYQDLVHKSCHVSWKIMDVQIWQEGSCMNLVVNLGMFLHVFLSRSGEVIRRETSHVSWKIKACKFQDESFIYLVMNLERSWHDANIMTFIVNFKLIKKKLCFVSIQRGDTDKKFSQDLHNIRKNLM